MVRKGDRLAMMTWKEFRDSWETWRKKVDAAIEGGGTEVDAGNVVYDNSTSGLVATNAEDAINEVVTMIGDIKVENAYVSETTLYITTKN